MNIICCIQYTSVRVQQDTNYRKLFSRSSNKHNKYLKRWGPDLTIPQKSPQLDKDTMCLHQRMPSLCFLNQSMKNNTRKSNILYLIDKQGRNNWQYTGFEKKTCILQQNTSDEHLLTAWWNKITSKINICAIEMTDWGGRGQEERESSKHMIKKKRELHTYV